MSNRIFLFSVLYFLTFSISAQDTMAMKMFDGNYVKGYHLGVVQPIISINKGETTNLLDYDVYAIGFPVGITLATRSSVMIDLEIVPFIAPALEKRDNYNVHLLYHPGVLVPLGSGFTFGFRLAYESGQGQFGFTPLINKSFPISSHTKFFLEIVAPGRFGPNPDSGYTQIFGLHVGIGL